MTNSIIRLYYDDIGHVGVEKAMVGISDHYWFPNLKFKVKQYIENYIKCLSYSIASGKSKREMQIYEKDTVTFRTISIHIDHFGLLEETRQI